MLRSTRITHQIRSICDAIIARRCYGGIFLLVFIPIGVWLCVTYVLLSDELLARLSYTTVSLLLCVILSLTVISETLLFLVLAADPGIVDGDTAKHPYAHLCRVCHVVVEDFDHHCGVLGACIGKGNFHYFLLFSILTSVLSVIGFVLSLPFAFIVLRSALKGFHPQTDGSLRHLVEAYARQILLPAPRSISLLLTVVSFYAAALTLALACGYGYLACAGKHSLERRRQKRREGCGCCVVFSRFCYPRLTWGEIPSQSCYRTSPGGGAV